MSSLTFTEKRRLEQFLGMSSGYVLNYSNREFGELVRDTTGCDIFDQRYNLNSGSKANRLRAFWDKESDAPVGKLLTAILEDSNAAGSQAEVCRLIVARLLGDSSEKSVPSAPPPAKPSLDPTHYSRLFGALQSVMQLAPQPRGFAFERFLDDAFATFDLAPRKSFRLVGEQIDGSFHLANETYLVEAKWQDAQIGNRDLQSFAGVVRSKSDWSRGLYVSYSGFSADGLEAFGRGDATRIICIDGFELWQIFTQKLNLADVLSLKTRRAAETGRAHCPVRELFQL